MTASADGRLVLFGARDGTTRLMDAERGHLVHRLPSQPGYVRCLDLSPDARLALSGNMRDSKMRFWDLEAERCLQVFEGHSEGIYDVAFDAQQRRALSSSRDIRLWDLETGQCTRVFRGHTDTIRSVVWSADQRQALSASHDRTVWVWNIDNGACLRVLEGHSTGVVKAVWSSKARRVLSCDWNGGVRRWDLPGSTS